MPRITSAQADVAQNAVLVPGSTYYLALHTADPSTTGASEGTDGRKSITFASSSGGTQASNSSQSWSALTAGTYLRGGALTSSITPGSGAIISVASGAITLTAG
jgi:hypothetical protein